MRSSFAAAATVAVAALLAVPAAAKEGVRAKLDRPVALAGAKTVVVKWRLVDEHGELFKAGRDLPARLALRARAADRRGEAGG